MQFPRVKAISRRFKYRWRMWRLKASEQYIRQAFSSLACTGEGDWLEIPLDGEILAFNAWGNQVHIKVMVPTMQVVNVDTKMKVVSVSKCEPNVAYECVIKEGNDGEVYVDEWRGEKRDVLLEFGAVHSTNWWEVFRTGSHVQNLDFLKYLRILYGDGKFGLRDCNGAMER